jgi:hypothetical protein
MGHARTVQSPLRALAINRGPDRVIMTVGDFTRTAVTGFLQRALFRQAQFDLPVAADHQPAAAPPEVAPGLGRPSALVPWSPGEFADPLLILGLYISDG